MQTALKPVYEFLEKLSQNNNREWFNANKEEYLNAYELMIQFADHLLWEMNQFDTIETPTGKRSLFRIYRDVRFAKDKRPYKNSWSGGYRRATSSLRGGYYFHLEPGNTFLAGGFFGPSKEDLLHIRKHISLDDQPLREVLADKDTSTYFGEMVGEKLKTAPKGFEKDHPSLDLLQFKQFTLRHSFNDKEATSPDFHLSLAAGFKNLLPFFDVMSEILTTDLNGHSLV